jgi:hypothetical protein
MTFFHGSPIAGITELGTRSRTHDETKSSAVYITPNRAYALFYIRDLEVNYVTCGVMEEGYIRYDERFSEQMKTLYSGRSGYLYSCTDNSGFEATSTRGVWVSKSPVRVESVEFIPDVYTELMKYEVSGDIKVMRYESFSDTEKHDIYEMIVWSLYKSGLTEKSSAKADFYRENFPNAWEYVKEHPEMKQDILNEWEKRRNT